LGTILLVRGYQPPKQKFSAIIYFQEAAIGTLARGRSPFSQRSIDDAAGR
jgi:hypothetical protein